MKVTNLILPMVVLTALIIPNNQVVAGPCETKLTEWENHCRNLQVNKLTKALCWGATITGYAACLAGSYYGGGGFGFTV